jgi:hypothetical protein
LSQKAPKSPFLGASSPWDEDDDTTYHHVLRQAADMLQARLKNRLLELNSTQLSTEGVVIEMRRQMAEAAVDGNLMLASEISESLWALLQYKDSGEPI